MKKIIALSILNMIICQHMSAQPGKTDMEKMKAARQEIEKIQKDPAMAGLLKGLPVMDSLMKNMPSGKTARTANDNKADSSGLYFPSKKNKQLDALPIRTFTIAELISYLHNLNAVLSGFMLTNYGKDITNIPETAVKMTGTGIGFWLDGETGEGALIALKGSELNPDNITLLNNAGGMLTGSGLGFNAIPILQYALDKQPGNNMILNNLGQAYLQLGDDKKAEQYFQQCVSSYPDYPDANLALAYIYRHRGNQPAALKYGEHSLRGGWSEGAYNLVTKLKRKADGLYPSPLSAA
jgi:predicted Zn-dependent protease